MLGKKQISLEEALPTVRIPKPPTVAAESHLLLLYLNVFTPPPEKILDSTADRPFGIARYACKMSEGIDCPIAGKSIWRRLLLGCLQISGYDRGLQFVGADAVQ